MWKVRFCDFFYPVLYCPGYTFFLGLASRSNPWTDFNRLWLRKMKPTHKQTHKSARSKHQFLKLGKFVRLDFLYSSIQQVTGNCVFLASLKIIFFSYKVCPGLHSQNTLQSVVISNDFVAKIFLKVLFSTYSKDLIWGLFTGHASKLQRECNI